MRASGIEKKDKAWANNIGTMGRFIMANIMMTWYDTFIIKGKWLW